jgi:hypothetical protein
MEVAMTGSASGVAQERVTLVVGLPDAIEGPRTMWRLSKLRQHAPSDHPGIGARDEQP